MKQLFKNKFVEINLVKGFVFGGGINNSNSEIVLFLGPITFEITLPKKKVKSPYEVEL